MSQSSVEARISRISWALSVIVAAIVGSSFLYLYWPANPAELFISISTALAVMLVLRRVIASELESRHGDA